MRKVEMKWRKVKTTVQYQSWGSKVEKVEKKWKKWKEVEEVERSGKKWKKWKEVERRSREWKEVERSSREWKLILNHLNITVVFKRKIVVDDFQSWSTSSKDKSSSFCTQFNRGC